MKIGPNLSKLVSFARRGPDLKTQATATPAHQSRLLDEDVVHIRTPRTHSLKKAAKVFLHSCLGQSLAVAGAALGPLGLGLAVSAQTAARILLEPGQNNGRSLFDVKGEAATKSLFKALGVGLATLAGGPGLGLAATALVSLPGAVKTYFRSRADESHLTLVNGPSLANQMVRELDRELESRGLEPSGIPTIGTALRRGTAPTLAAALEVANKTLPSPMGALLAGRAFQALTTEESRAQEQSLARRGLIKYPTRPEPSEFQTLYPSPPQLFWDPRHQGSAATGDIRLDLGTFWDGGVVRRFVVGHEAGHLENDDTNATHGVSFTRHFLLHGDHFQPEEQDRQRFSNLAEGLAGQERERKHQTEFRADDRGVDHALAHGHSPQEIYLAAAKVFEGAGANETHPDSKDRLKRIWTRANYLVSGSTT